MISVSAPGDPVELMLGGSGGSEGTQQADRAANERAYLDKRQELGLDLPIFYFSISSLAYPDTLYKVPKPKTQQALSRLIGEFGNWPDIQNYYHALRTYEKTLLGFKPDSADADYMIDVRASYMSLADEGRAENIRIALQSIEDRIAQRPSLSSLKDGFAQVKAAFAHVEANATVWKLYVPSLHFYGFNNQYHRWLAKMLRFDFGDSYIDKRPIADKLKDALLWTLVISIISVVLTYIIAIPIGIFSARNRNSLADNVSTTTLFILYSLPNFWIATMLIIFLCGGDYLDIFPPGGVQDTFHSDEWSMGERIMDWTMHLILPIFCATYANFAFLSRQMRVGMLEVLGMDFIRTARAKGLKESKVVWKHAFRNSLIPIITLFASIFPALVGGSVIIETIFSLPGMGLLSFNAIIARDYPVIIAVFTLSGILTLIGILVADILYAVVDPRISYSKK